MDDVHESDHIDLLTYHYSEHVREHIDGRELYNMVCTEY